MSSLQSGQRSSLWLPSGEYGWSEAKTEPPGRLGKTLRFRGDLLTNSACSPWKAAGAARRFGRRPSETGDVDPKLAAAVDALLARRGIAVRTNDLGLFLRDVGPELRANQQRLFANLRAIGMTVTFRRAEPWIAESAQRRFGPATGTFRVSMRYQLNGAKAEQAATDVGYTFTVRQGRLQLVADDVVDQQLGAGREPWDFGPILAVRRPRALVIVDAAEPGLGNRLADQTVAVAKQVRKLWPAPLPHLPVVVAMRNPRVLTGSEPVAGAAEPAAVLAMRKPSLDGKSASGWIVVKPSARLGFDRAQTAHALAHLLPVRYGDQAPLWLNEGLARHAAAQQLVLTGRSAEVVRERRLIRREELGTLAALPADADFATSRRTAASGVSWLAVEYLITKAGLKAFNQLSLEMAFHGYNWFRRETYLSRNTGLTEGQLVESLRRSAG